MLFIIKLFFLDAKHDDKSMASRKNVSLQKILSKFGVSKNTIHRRMLQSKQMTFKSLLKKPCFKKKPHKTVSLTWVNHLSGCCCMRKVAFSPSYLGTAAAVVKNMISCGDKWLSTIVSGKKKWNLDRPDRYKFC